MHVALGGTARGYQPVNRQSPLALKIRNGVLQGLIEPGVETTVRLRQPTKFLEETLGRKNVVIDDRQPRRDRTVEKTIACHGVISS